MRLGLQQTWQSHTDHHFSKWKASLQSQCPACTSDLQQSRILSLHAACKITAACAFGTFSLIVCPMDPGMSCTCSPKKATTSVRRGQPCITFIWLSQSWLGKKFMYFLPLDAASVCLSLLQGLWSLILGLKVVKHADGCQEMRGAEHLLDPLCIVTCIVAHCAKILMEKIELQHMQDSNWNLLKLRESDT